jgi:peptidoglycan hydrolase-like protein with peptidoglycan-binding domain
VVSADEITRQVQEELRKRRLYYGDLDGQQTPELGVALKRYQERKGFPASGVVDAQTLRSMGIAEPGGQPPPDVPILRSEAPAQPLPPDAQNLAPTPMSIAGDINVPPPSREELHEFMRRYLAACETQDVNDELAYYAPRVDYFAKGIVPKTYVRSQLSPTTTPGRSANTRWMTRSRSRSAGIIPPPPRSSLTSWRIRRRTAKQTEK